MRRTRAARRTAGAALAGPIDGFIVDLDGVVWVGDAVIPGAAEALNELRARGNQVVFLTNEPRGSRAEYARRLVSLVIDASPDWVVTSGAATPDFLATHEGVDGQTAFVIGSAGAQGGDAARRPLPARHRAWARRRLRRSLLASRKPSSSRPSAPILATAGTSPLLATTQTPTSPEDDVQDPRRSSF
jgi:hypothetical protein